MKLYDYYQFRPDIPSLSNLYQNNITRTRLWDVLRQYLIEGAALCAATIVSHF